MDASFLEKTKLTGTLLAGLTIQPSSSLVTSSGEYFNAVVDGFRSCKKWTFAWTNIGKQSSSESEVMQQQVKDDALQQHPSVNDTLLSFISSLLLCLFDWSCLSSRHSLTLNECQIMSCALLDLLIQIPHSNLVQSVADFHNRDLGFDAVSPLCISGDRSSSATILICLGRRPEFK